MKIILHILLLLLIISTVTICISKPEMHKNVIVYNSEYTLMPQKQTEVSTETIPIMQKTSEPIKETKKTEPIITKEVKTVSKAETQTTTAKKQASKAIENKTKTVSVPIVKTSPATTKTTATQNISKIEKNEPKIETTKTKTTVPIVKTLTQQEETIAWNVWRSNLQNKIMQDTKLPLLPTGVIFKFSFTVDKYGKISNLQTWSDSPTYTPYAIQYIAPVIRSYQGRSILNFPEGTARTITDVKGGWKISANERYSTPQDYNDIEKVQK